MQPCYRCQDREAIESRRMSATPPTVEELLVRVPRLPAGTPQASALLLDPRYETFQAQWVGWLEEYDVPSYYDRGTASAMHDGSIGISTTAG